VLAKPDWKGKIARAALMAMLASRSFTVNRLSTNGMIGNRKQVKGGD